MRFSLFLYLCFDQFAQELLVFFDFILSVLTNHLIVVREGYHQQVLVVVFEYSVGVDCWVDVLISHVFVMHRALNLDDHVDIFDEEVALEAWNGFLKLYLIVPKLLQQHEVVLVASRDLSTC